MIAIVIDQSEGNLRICTSKTESGEWNIWKINKKSSENDFISTIIFQKIYRGARDEFLALFCDFLCTHPFTIF